MSPTSQARTEVSVSTPDDCSDVVTLPIGVWARAWVQVTVAFLVALVVCSAAFGRLNRHELHTRSDLVGYPTFAGFDVSWYDRVYLLWVVGLPVLTLLSFVIIRRIGSRVLGPPVGSVYVSARLGADSTASRQTAAAAGRLLLVGAVLSLAAMGALGGGVSRPIVMATAVGSMVVVVPLALSYLYRDRVPPWWLLDVATALVLPTPIIAAWIATERAQVTLTDGTIVHYRFIPWWLMLAAVTALWISVSLVRRDPRRLSALVRRFTVFVLAPTFLFVWRSFLVGSVGVPDFFHDGEILTGAALLRSGEMPWRDFLAIHGLLYDSFQGLVPIEAFGNSWWGYAAGANAITAPVALVLLYLLLAVLFERSWAYLTLVVIALAAGPSIMGGFVENAWFNVRFMFSPVVIALLILLLRRPTTARAVFFTTLLFGQFIVTPESAYFLPALAGTVLVFEFVSRERGAKWTVTFRRTLTCSVVGAIEAGLFLLFLVSKHSLSAYIYYFRTFAADHALTGGIPVIWGGLPFAAAVYLCPAVVMLSFGYVVWRVRSGRHLWTEDWAMLATAGVVAVYYTKFLARADNHIYQPLGLALPLMFYIGFRLTTLPGELAGLPATRLERRSHNVLVVPLIVALLFPVVPWLRYVKTEVKALPTRYRPTDVVQAVDPRLGYAKAGPIVDQLLPRLRRLFGTLPSDATVFDFTNQPLLYHYLLDKKPVTKFPHVSMAIPQSTQADLVVELARAQPTVVVMNGGFGLPSWDGVANIVRHYDVSEWILRHYRPWTEVQGQVFYLRNDLQAPAVASPDPVALSDLPFSVAECSWGVFPQNSSVAPMSANLATHQTLSTEPVTSLVTYRGWAGEGVGHRAALAVVAVSGKIIVASAVTSGARPDAAASIGVDPTSALAYELLVPETDTDHASGHDIVVMSLFDDGTARLAQVTPPTFPVPATVHYDGRSYTFVAAPGGVVDSRSALSPSGGRFNLSPPNPPIDMIRVGLPAQRKALDWLVLRRDAGIAAGVYAISDTPTDSKHFIDARSTVRPKELAIQVGSCPQWSAYRTDAVYLFSASGASGLEVIAGSRL